VYFSTNQIILVTRMPSNNNEHICQIMSRKKRALQKQTNKEGKETQVG
jgi:hypothetical protein